MQIDLRSPSAEASSFTFFGTKNGNLLFFQDSDVIIINAKVNFPSFTKSFSGKEMLIFCIKWTESMFDDSREGKSFEKR